jgi:DNA-binding response OmpR family regulator
VRILVVEDDQRLARLVERVLTQERHSVELAFAGDDGLDWAEGGGFDLVILDRMLPGINGLEVCRRLRAGGVDTPVLMLTARGSVEDRVDGLNAGADDYLVKPFAMSELVARVNARLRRDRKAQVTTVLTAGDLTLDLLRREVRRGEETIELTPKEFTLLEYLMRNEGITLTRHQILEQVWQSDSEATSKVVDTYVHYLREKIGGGRGTGFIKTVRGVGYKFEGLPRR